MVPASEKAKAVLPAIMTVIVKVVWLAFMPSNPKPGSVCLPVRKVAVPIIIIVITLKTGANIVFPEVTVVLNLQEKKTPVELAAVSLIVSGENVSPCPKILPVSNIASIIVI
jgi:hypothetical protein